jgi:hypothetical protein
VPAVDWSFAGAHYYTVIRRPSDGQLTQLDFGPVGGDIAFATKPRRGLWSWACRVVSRTPAVPIGTQAEVREVKVPPHSFVDRGRCLA